MNVYWLMYESNVAYIRLLQHLYCGQQGQIRTDKLSKAFDITRGTKQGDPLSSMLFNAILEHIMRKIKPSWCQKEYGIQMGSNERTRPNSANGPKRILQVGPMVSKRPRPTEPNRFTSRLAARRMGGQTERWADGKAFRPFCEVFLFLSNRMVCMRICGMGIGFVDALDAILTLF